MSTGIEGAALMVYVQPFTNNICKIKPFLLFDCLFHYLPWSTYVPPDFKAQNTLITDPINGFYFSLFYPAQYYYQSSLSTGDFGLWFNLNFCCVQPYNFIINWT
jgi:hypothetical protein